MKIKSVTKQDNGCYAIFYDDVVVISKTDVTSPTDRLSDEEQLRADLCEYISDLSDYDIEKAQWLQCPACSCVIARNEFLSGTAIIQDDSNNIFEGMKKKIKELEAKLQTAEKAINYYKNLTEANGFDTDGNPIKYDVR